MTQAKQQADQSHQFLPKKVILETMTAATAKKIAPRSLADARFTAKQLSKDLGRRYSVRMVELQLRDLEIDLEFFAVDIANPSIRKSVWIETLDDESQSFDAQRQRDE